MAEQRGWEQAAAAARAELKEWRGEHPHATFTEIEDAVTERMDQLRTELLTDLALQTRAAELHDKQRGAPPRCPDCGERLQGRGKQHRRVVVSGGGAVDLHREYGVCPACGVGLFPPG